MVQHTEKFDNLLAYFERAIPQIVITVNHKGETVAWVPSTSSNDPYTVWIDESSEVPHATKCSCNDHWYRKSYCKHIQCADLYYQRIAAIFAHDEPEKVAEPVVEQPEIVDEPALEGIYLARLQQWVAYNVKPAKKNVEHADHCPHCGKLCKGDICGYCVQ